ncbi:HNH endonuclease [Mycobacterium phage Dante]|uniref:HNH endonuclease n=1 Tax=Mycobacterium phage Dante TaxID=1698357 RepID=A0A0K1Y7W2_9CAUD|nr:HNH endonuclease [Mycobacterium phage Dante]AKY02984.1 HNH endonuclease [Mycobacterium phage Dante]
MRFEILHRDGHACHYCGAKAPNAELTVDHIVPSSLGGSDDPTNLVTACQPCNSGKSSSNPDSSLVAEVSKDAERFAAAIKEVARQREAEAAEVKKWFSRAWFLASDGLIDIYDEDEQLIARNCSIDVYMEPLDYPHVHTWRFPERDANWVSTVQSLIAAGLERDHIERLIGIAMASRVGRKVKWRYFCGCAWKAVRELHTAAAELVRNEEGVR